MYEQMDMENQKSGGGAAAGGSSMKLPIMMVVMFLIIVALLGVTIGLAATPGTPDRLKFSDKKWIIQLERGWAPYSDENKVGKLEGFHKDLVEGVCAAGDLTCEVVMGTASNCFSSDNDIAAGLAVEEYDGCAGWSITNHRNNSATFTDTWTTIPQNGFYALKGNEGVVTCTTGTGCKVEKGKKIGLVAGWSSSRACLKANDLIDASHNPLLFSCGELVKALQDKVIDVFFIALTDGSHHNQCLGLNETRDGVVRIAAAGLHNCQEGGYAIATKTDSNLPNVWNEAFRKYTSAGSFKDLCGSDTYKDLIKTCCTDFSNPICK